MAATFLVFFLAAIVLSGAPSISAHEPDPGSLSSNSDFEWIERPKISHLKANDPSENRFVQENKGNEPDHEAFSDNSGFQWVELPKIASVNLEDPFGNQLAHRHKNKHHKKPKPPAGSPKPVEDEHEHEHEHVHGQHGHPHHKHLHHVHHSRRHLPPKAVAPSAEPVLPSPAEAPVASPTSGASDFFAV